MNYKSQSIIRQTVFKTSFKKNNPEVSFGLNNSPLVKLFRYWDANNADGNHGPPIQPPSTL